MDKHHARYLCNTLHKTVRKRDSNADDEDDDDLRLMVEQNLKFISTKPGIRARKGLASAPVSRAATATIQQLAELVGSSIAKQ
ncbi:unnamed protein product [Dovyalis caffra]|uniref:Uncharacterized protein n=1 Tax=Dovyalis caffra TaxID=77055 RepID=A0AAV1RS44_9ROSI|nr:unnamed protein product [Dovyalis caffra]